jgi:D-alanine transaminase
MATPLPICYLNGSFEPLADARISPLDRGFLFADGVYEVLPVFTGRPFRFKEHFDRLDRSLNEIRLPSPHTHAEWQALLDELVARNGGGDMYVYIQVTRGMEYGRNHAFPAKVVPTVFGMASPLPVLTDAIRTQGLKAITVEDFRWGRCDIKSIALLANVLIKQSAEDAGANEAIIVSQGNVLEGASTSVFAVIDGVLKTPPNSHHLLPGTTRDVVLELAKDAFNCKVEPVSVAELRRAQEIWIAAATRDVLPVTLLDGAPVGTGRPGPLWAKMSTAFNDLRQRLGLLPTHASGPAPR